MLTVHMTSQHWVPMFGGICSLEAVFGRDCITFRTEFPHLTAAPMSGRDL